MITPSHTMLVCVTTTPCLFHRHTLSVSVIVTATGYLQTVSLAAHSVGMESEGLHTTMMAVPRPVAATVTSADLAENATIDSSQLSSLQSMPMVAAPVAARVDSSDGFGRVVDSQAISDALGKTSLCVCV